MKRVALPGSAVKVWFLGQDLNRGPSLSEKKKIRQANIKPLHHWGCVYFHFRFRTT